eukprot:c8540_g1_i1.p1 GENE.c8540_g1_i1~~c8540_g1_i1.p1  ORF type:complete len:276 (-),score=84.26 c8540_g1_i1:41-805(-)
MATQGQGQDRAKLAEGFETQCQNMEVKLDQVEYLVDRIEHDRRDEINLGPITQDKRAEELTQSIEKCSKEVVDKLKTIQTELTSLRAVKDKLGNTVDDGVFKMLVVRTRDLLLRNGKLQSSRQDWQREQIEKQTLTVQEQQQQHQQQATSLGYDQELEIMNQNIIEQKNKLHEIEKQTQQMLDMIATIRTLIEEQGQQITTIYANIDHTVQNVGAGVEELEKAEDNLRQSRKWKLILVCVLFLIMIFFFGFLIF